MVSMNRMRAGLLCMTSELVRVPSPKNRTPFISVPSVTPVAAKMMLLARREILRRVDALEVGDPHRPAALLVLRLGDHEPREDLAVQAAHRRGREHAFGRAAGAHHRVHAGADDRGRDAGRQIAVAESAGCARRWRGCRAISCSCRGRSSTMTTRSSTSRPRHLAIALRFSRDRRVEVDRRPSSSARRRASPCRGRARAAGRPARTRRARRSRSARRSRRGSCPRADRRRCRPAGSRRRRAGRLAREPDLLADVEHRRLVALAFADDDGAVDRHGVQHSPHRLDGGLVGLVAVALAHRVRAGDGRLLDDAEELEGEVGVHRARPLEQLAARLPARPAARSASACPGGSRARSRPASACGSRACLRRSPRPCSCGRSGRPDTRPSSRWRRGSARRRRPRARTPRSRTISPGRSRACCAGRGSSASPERSHSSRDA